MNTTLHPLHLEKNITNYPQTNLEGQVFMGYNKTTKKSFPCIFSPYHLAFFLLDGITFAKVTHWGFLSN